jgi:hypothetical protein
MLKAAANDPVNNLKVNSPPIQKGTLRVHVLVFGFQVTSQDPRCEDVNQDRAGNCIHQSADTWTFDADILGEW